MKIIELVIKQHPIWVTFGYLGLLAGVFYRYTANGQFLSLNELGDFLAGAFAPLAFYWLVRGFFLQSKELQNSVAALNYQAKELARSAEEQKNLAEATRNTAVQQNQIEVQRSWQQTMQLIQEADQKLQVALYSFSRLERRFTPIPKSDLSFPSLGNPHFGGSAFISDPQNDAIEDIRSQARVLKQETQSTLSRLSKVEKQIPLPDAAIPIAQLSQVYRLSALATEFRQQALTMNEEFVQLVNAP